MRSCSGTTNVNQEHGGRRAWSRSASRDRSSCRGPGIVRSCERGCRSPTPALRESRLARFPSARVPLPEKVRRRPASQAAGWRSIRRSGSSRDPFKRPPPRARRPRVEPAQKQRRRQGLHDKVAAAGPTRNAFGRLPSSTRTTTALTASSARRPRLATNSGWPIALSFIGGPRRTRPGASESQRPGACRPAHARFAPAGSHPPAVDK